MMVGELIQAWREKKQLSVRDLAQSIGVEHTALWRFEQGRPVQDRQWVKICVWLLTANSDKPITKN